MMQGKAKFIHTARFQYKAIQGALKNVKIKT